jgi:hypothetical protein
MVPAAVVEVAALPRTPNQKVDLAALPAPARAPVSTIGGEPRDELERDLAVFWADLLRRDGVGVHDDFFRIGGNSLLVMRVIAHVAKRYGVGVPAQYVFENPTVSALALQLRTTGDETPTGADRPTVPDDEGVDA